MTYAAALFALLARYTGQTDLVVGTPIANRTRSETQSLIGFFVNTLVLRVSASGDPAFAEVLDRVRVAAVGAYANQDLPFEWLVREVRPDRELGKTPLFQVMLVLQSDVDAAIEIPGLRVAPVDFDRGTSRFDLTVVLDEQGDSVSGFVEYSDDVFDRQVIDAFASAYAAILTAVAGDPGLHLSRLPLGVAEAATFAGAVTAAKPHLCVHELVAERARLHPGAIAVSHGSEEVSYADLVAKAHQLAQRLRALGVGAEDVVGIMLGRSVETVVAVLGVLFAGGAYLPLDPSAPKHRLDYMIERAAPRVIIAPDDAELPTHGASVVRRREVANPAAQPSADEAPWKPEATIHPDRAAYVMFTSGSSGVPKGVTVQHAGLANLVHALVCRLELTDADRVLQFVSPSFDVSVSEIFMALVSGATLVLARYEQLLPGPDLVELLRAQRITTVSLPASVLAALPHAQLPQLRNLIVGGETTSAATLDFWSRGRLLFHCYGPTETTVCATAAAFEEGAVATRIGHPLTNVTAYVLGSSLERLPVGAVGELYIGGVGVARGYLRRPDSTAERFLPDPFSSCPGARMYRSGDRARVLSDGSIQFLGRADDQVKIRGHRVELGDVESVLAQHPSVRQCAVVVRDGSAGDKKLVSYVLVEDTAAFGAPELRTFCRERLPEYMVPSAFIRLDTFPRTATGKVDRAALPDVDRDELAPRDAVAPRDALEEQVLAVWRTVLDVPSLGVTDNFFDVGGNSFLIIRMMTEIERVTRQRLPISAAFEHGTVAEMATVLRERLDKREVPSLVTMRRGGTKTPLFFVHPVGGNVLCYGRLVRELGRERPMFGLQARGAEGTSPPCDSIAKMATAYVDEMLAAHPRRPFALLGWSFGGGVAFEMAAVLRSRGASVGFVVLLDAAAPLAGAADAEITYHDLMPTLLHDLVGLLGAKALPSKEALQTMPEEEIERLAVDLVRGARLFVPGTEVDEVRRYVRLYRTHMNAHLRHHPTPFDGRVVYASAEASQSAGKERMIEFWRRHSGEFEVITIPGRHHDILRPPNVEQLAAQLKPLIAAVDDS
jgi:amino acid adenylation domain-containing protein